MENVSHSGRLSSSEHSEEQRKYVTKGKKDKIIESILWSIALPVFPKC